MSFSAPRRVTVTTTATRLDDSTDTVANGALILKNLGTASVYVGKSTVVTTTGFPVGAGETLELTGVRIGQAGGVWAIVATGTADVAILQVND